MKCPICHKNTVKDELKPFNGDKNLLQFTGDLVCTSCGGKFNAEIMKGIDHSIRG